MMEKKTVTEISRVLSTGDIWLDEYKEIWEDGKFLMRDLKPHSLVIHPDTEYTGGDEEIKRIVAAVHTPGKKAAYVKVREDIVRQEQEYIETRQTQARAENAANAAAGNSDAEPT